MIDTIPVFDTNIMFALTRFILYGLHSRKQIIFMVVLLCYYEHKKVKNGLITILCLPRNLHICVV